MPANTAIIPIKAVRVGDQATGSVRGIGEMESGDKISPSYLNLTDVSLSGNTAFDTSTLFVDGTNNRVGINSSSPQKNLQINDSTSPTIRFSRDTSYYWEIGHTSSDFQLNSQTGGTVMHLNYDGNVGIGTTSPSTSLEINTTNTLGSTFTGTTQGEGISVSQTSYTADNYVSLLEGKYVSNQTGPHVRIAARYNGSGSSLVFGTTNSFASGITKTGMALINTGQAIFGGNDTYGVGSADSFIFNQGADWRAYSSRNSTSSAGHIAFYNPNGGVGSITTNGSATLYNTSSDYRLKENVTPITDGIDRVKQLDPSRFNFIADATKTVDGFLAHEVQDVVPEAVTGNKDAVDSEGNPEYQGIDQAKLVPLLTAALKEAITKIEDLETRIATLEGS